jgi:hypothetical protein
MKASERLARRHPIGFGTVKWGPLPHTRDMWILWGGPGDGLLLCASDPGKPGCSLKRIEHPTASGNYGKLDDAEKAVMAFIREGLADA